MRYLTATVLFGSLLFAAPAFAAGVVNGDPAKAQPIVSSLCVACHGIDGNSLIPVNPNLAGQHPEYIYKQLRDYKSGERKNPIMAGIVAGLSDDDMANLAAYFASQKPRSGMAHDATLVTSGQRLYRGGNSTSGIVACAGCHSPDGAGIPAQYPRLKGQQRDYTLAQLRAFRAGERVNDAASMMRTIASRMSDKEMEAVAEYVSGLK